MIILGFNGILAITCNFRVRPSPSSFGLSMERSMRYIDKMFLNDDTCQPPLETSIYSGKLVEKGYQFIYLVSSGGVCCAYLVAVLHPRKSWTDEKGILVSVPAFHSIIQTSVGSQSVRCFHHCFPCGNSPDIFFRVDLAGFSCDA
jgi:hypothetical protein